MSSRAGRKRKHDAKRHEGGKIVQKVANPTTSPIKVAQSQPHRMRLYEDFCDDARAATALGQLNLVGAVPNDLYAAAMRFAGVVRRWRTVIDAPRPAPSVAGQSVVSEGGDDEPPLAANSDEPKTPEEEFAEYRADYDRAMGWLANVSKTAKAITLWVVAEGGRVPSQGYEPLMQGLRALNAGVQKNG